MKILVVGDGHAKIHEVAVARAFQDLGHDVGTFYWHTYFASTNPLIRFWQRVQYKFLFGPVLEKLNSELVELAVRTKPDVVFIYRGTHIFPRAIYAIKNGVDGCTVCGYNNDDPFSEGYNGLLWRHFLRGATSYDVVFAYRHHNLLDFKRHGVKKTELLRSWYLPWSNYRVELVEEDRNHFNCDVVFIGHYENDGRLQLLEEIARNGFQLRIYGPPYEWNHLLEKSEQLKQLSPVRLVWGEEYNKALCGAKIALCFLSKLNRDTYTRRCFEIPATGTLMIAEYTDDLASLFTEGVDAEFFRDQEELISKITRYLNDEKLRDQVSASGRNRVITDGHDIYSRMKNVLDVVDRLKSEAEK
jgi:spore maturation protein CgeB